jgi:hypothetical protein
MFDADDEDLDFSPEVLALLSRRRARTAMLAPAPAERSDAERTPVPVL